MEKYLDVLLAQVRCKKAHKMIEEEIRDHMESQIEANLEFGMSQEEAVREAVRDMGSPLEVGMALDCVHRPAVAGEMIVLMLIVSTVSVLIQMLIGNMGVRGMFRSEFTIFTIIGFLIMLLIYHLDYSFMAAYGKVIAAIMIGILFIGSLGIGVDVIGGSYFRFYSEHMPATFSVYSFMMLYVPVYGAVLYKYYGTGVSGMVRAILWMMLPIFLVLRLPALFLAVVLFFALSVVLSVAVWKDWFKIAKVKFLITYWGVVLISPILFVLAAFHMPLLTGYQMERVKIWFGMGEHTYAMREYLHSFIQQSQIIGGDGSAIASQLVDFDTTYILTYITSCYGILVGLFIILLMAFIVMKVFHISLRQRNQLGMIMGCGCGSVFLINGIANLLQNIGLFPVTGSFFPFFTYSGSFLITSYILMGIIMSIYRHKNILPVHFDTGSIFNPPLHNERQL